MSEVFKCRYCKFFETDKPENPDYWGHCKYDKHIKTKLPIWHPKMQLRGYISPQQKGCKCFEGGLLMLPNAAHEPPALAGEASSDRRERG